MKTDRDINEPTNETIEATFKAEGVTIDLVKKNQLMVIRWAGVCDSKDPALVLSPVLDQVVSGVTGMVVHVDFRPLTYLNSASVTHVIDFVSKLDRTASEVTLIYSSTMGWQRVNFSAMRIITRKLTRTRVVAESPEPSSRL